MATPTFLSTDACDVLMPMHILISTSGELRHVGPTLAKLRPGMDLVGRQFLDVFHLRRPNDIRSISDLRSHSKLRLTLQFRDDPETTFKGVMVTESDCGGLLVNLSFGVSILEAIHAYDLVATDFAPTDLTVEMLYLIEAKTTILAEWQELNERLEIAKTEAEQQAFTDTLTGLKNRRAMDHILNRMIEGRQPFGLVCLDLDYFKQVNDRFGHAVGDVVLKRAADIMRKATRAGDTLIRAGGDEFVFILPQMLSPSSINNLGLRLIRQLEAPIDVGGASCEISASIGATSYWGETDLSLNELFIQADWALYASKNAGRGRMTFYSAAHADADFAKFSNLAEARFTGVLKPYLSD